MRALPLPQPRPSSGALRSRGGGERTSGRADSSPLPLERGRGRGWLLSPSQDLLWFQGSALVGVALAALFAELPRLDGASYALGQPALWVLLAWGVFFDGTHVVGTYARSYLAPDAASRAGLPGPASWALVLLGPALALLDHALFAPGPSVLGQAGPLFRAFLLGAYLWAYWHLVRQHYGLLVLYRRRAGRDDALGGRLEAALLWAGALYPYLRFSLSPAFAASGLPVLTPAALVGPSRLALDVGFALLMVALLVLLAARPGAQLGPRHLFLASVIGLHLAVFALVDHLLTITAALTIAHNLQYHRVVWQHERGRGRVPLGGLGRYLGAGVLLGLAWYGPRVLGVAALPVGLGRNVLLGLGWGVAFHHYLVDGRIWRVRRTPEVARALDAGAST